MLKLADIKPGDIVVDPMCGGGSIPIEGAIGYSSGFHVAGDMNDKAFARARDNVRAIVEETKKSIQTDVVQWDVTRMPLRDNSVDVFITDLVIRAFLFILHEFSMKYLYDSVFF